MGRTRNIFVRTVKGLEVRVTPEAADVVRRTAREVQQLIASEPAVDGLAQLGEDSDLAAEDGPEDPGGSSELQGMLAAGSFAGLAGLGGEVPPLSDDPALARLFPSAYEDGDQAEEYRRFTYAELHAGKLAGLERLRLQLAAAPHILLDEESAQVWLAALNDIRLVIGSRIGLTDDSAEQLDRLPGGDLRAVTYALYQLLSTLQESLVIALAGW
jgi:hypothetical protein